LKYLSGFICKVRGDEKRHVKIGSSDKTLCGIKDFEIISPQVNLKAFLSERLVRLNTCLKCQEALELAHTKLL